MASDSLPPSIQPYLITRERIESPWNKNSIILFYFTANKRRFRFKDKLGRPSENWVNDWLLRKQYLMMSIRPLIPENMQLMKKFEGSLKRKLPLKTCLPFGLSSTPWAFTKFLRFKNRAKWSAEKTIGRKKS